MNRFDSNLFSELTVQGHGVAPLALIALRMNIAGTASPVYELITDYQESQGVGYRPSFTIDSVCIREGKGVS
jgi:hypothetical protein